MAGMFAIILIVTNQFYHGKTEQTTGMLCSLPMDWRNYPANCSRMESG